MLVDARTVHPPARAGRRARAPGGPGHASARGFAAAPPYSDCAGRGGVPLACPVRLELV